MPGYKEHSCVAVLLTVIALAALHWAGLEYFTWYHYPLLILVAGLYGILPDIDIGTSKANHLVIVVGLLFVLAALFIEQYKWLAVVVIVMLIGITLFLKHRGITHRWWFGLLLVSPLAYFGLQFAFVGLLGYWSHIILDSF
jgi:membrane-bound metal-dependent hydrolase YbcI (DUF457 family)